MQPPIYDSKEARIRRLEAQVGRLLHDYRIGASFIGSFPEAASSMSLRHAGNDYHLSNTLNVRPTLVPTGTAPNLLYAVPFYIPNIGSIASRIAIEVTTLQSGNARLGIYDSDRNLYPSRLLLDAGVVSTSSTGVKASSVFRQGLTRGLKWLAVVYSASPTVRGIMASTPNVGGWNPLGVNLGTWAYYMGWQVAHSYAALPAVYPAGGSKNVQISTLMLRFAV
ncbi:hypothetical protein LCGC14_1957380 [marine sediment metagenome]|uniref:Uncharacterized protein n=1 Tax=marine sediment metagenome TaxID=412755 RepID=A0A0F9G3W6_9ZZZZ